MLSLIPAGAFSGPVALLLSIEGNCPFEFSSVSKMSVLWLFYGPFFYVTVVAVRHWELYRLRGKRGLPKTLHDSWRIRTLTRGW